MFVLCVRDANGKKRYVGEHAETFPTSGKAKRFRTAQIALSFAWQVKGWVEDGLLVACNDWLNATVERVK